MKKYILILLVLLLVGCSTKNTNSSLQTEEKEQQNEVVEKNNETEGLITEEELKASISKVVITDDNWRDVFFVDIDTHAEINNFGEEVIDHKKVTAKLTLNEGYYGDLSKIGLKLYDNVYGNEIVWENLEQNDAIHIYYDDGELMHLIAGKENHKNGDPVYWVYEGHGLFAFDAYPFIMDNITLNQAGGDVYYLDLPKELIKDDLGIEYIDYVDSDGVACIFPLNDIQFIESFINK